MLLKENIPTECISHDFVAAHIVIFGYCRGYSSFDTLGRKRLPLECETRLVRASTIIPPIFPSEAGTESRDQKLGLLPRIQLSSRR